VARKATNPVRTANKINRKERKEHRDLGKLKGFFAIFGFFGGDPLILIAALRSIEVGNFNFIVQIEP
jgi:hypothetical protein